MQSIDLLDQQVPFTDFNQVVRDVGIDVCVLAT